jgi:phosphoserine phosphatase RsbU/P
MEKTLDTPAARHVPTPLPGMADTDPAWPNPAWAETVRRFSPRVELGPDCAPAPATADHVTDDQVRLVLDVSRLLAVPTELDPLLSRIAEITTVLLDCERASIFLYDKVSNELWTKVALGSREIRVPCHAGIVGHAFKSGEVVHVPEPYSDPRFNPEPDKRSGFVTRNLLSAPMAGVDGKPVGVIQAVNKRNAAFAPSDLSLIQLVAEQAGVAVQRHRLQLEALEIVALRHEMDLAKRTQEALIPKQPPCIPGIECCGWTLPASITGGDCFDLWRLSDGRLGILVADASGHGLAPALVVSQARTLVRAISEFESDPHRLLGHVNARLAEDLEWGQFVTAFLAFLSPGGVLHWSSAGHGPVLVRPAVGLPMQTLDPPVQPLGVLPTWTDRSPAPIPLERTGSLIVVTDGIFEATNAENEQLGIERMCETLDAHQHESPKQLLSNLRESVRTWYAGRDALDDQTIVIVQRGAADDQAVA